jgi:outer membrane protein OmpA-like peptidoglycan-associated protein
VSARRPEHSAARSGSNWAPPQHARESAAHTSESPQALPPAVRSRFEAGFGRDFSDVRVHAGPHAAASARSLRAQAYTVGADLHFAAGRYRPDSEQGRHLIAHELAHVAQQSRGGPARVDAEVRADVAATQVMSGRTVASDALGGAPHSVQAKPDDGSAGPSDIPAFPPKVLAEFALNSDTPTSAHLAEIDSVASVISLHIGMRVRGRASVAITGHTDRSGSEKVNQPLGQRRADAVKAALIAALTKHGVDLARVGEIPATSMGESSPAVPTADGVLNAKNRRVQIDVQIGEDAAPSPPPPTFDPFAPLPPGTLAPEGPVGPRNDQGDLWRRMEENRRKIDEFDRKHPPANKSLSDAIIDKVMEEAIDPIIRKLPVSKDLKDLARSGVRKGLEKGSEAACDSAIDGTSATGPEAEALKAACKAALKTKPGGSR